MKMLPTSALRATVCSFALAFIASAQGQIPATPTTPTTPAEPAPGTGVTATTPAAKPKPLGEADKRFFKEVSEAILFEQKLALLGTKSAQGEETKKTANTVNNDLKRIWEKFATLSQEKNVTIATEVSKSESTKAERLGKTKEDKFDKEFLDDLGKEAKKTTRLFESKSLQDADVKKFAEEWTPTIKSHEGAVDKAEKSLNKKNK